MICMICACFAGWDLYDLDLMHNFSISAKKDLDYLDHDLSEVCNSSVINYFSYRPDGAYVRMSTDKQGSFICVIGI